MSNIVHVVGTGTIGEPLVGLLADHAADFGIDEVSFHKRTPMIEDRAKVKDLVGRGRSGRGRGSPCLLRGDRARAEARNHGSDRARCRRDRLHRRATPTRSSTTRRRGPRLLARVEFGFGKMYARGINDEALDHDGDRHPGRVVQHTQHLGADQDAGDGIPTGPLPREWPLPVHAPLQRYQQDGSFIPSPQRRPPRRPRFGTHHAGTHITSSRPGYDLPVFSSAVKLNTQYMHVALQPPAGSGGDFQGGDRPSCRQPRVALTHKRSANRSSRSAAPRLLRADPQPDGRTDRDLTVRNGTEPAVLLHAPGWERPAVVDRRHPLAPPRRCRRTSGGTAPIPVPGGVKEQRVGLSPLALSAFCPPPSAPS